MDNNVSFTKLVVKDQRRRWIYVRMFLKLDPGPVQ